ncbi:MAG: hypothetical protein H7Z16_16355 [Pyrinomonadaceae bacterium]|nr:hypothetical protein [Pyrinomonadaceae bacterium]
MKTTSPTRQATSHLTADEEALFKCETALELKDQSDVEGAQKAMRRLWRRVGERPDTEGLHPSVAADVLLTTGILTRWVGGRAKIKGAQEVAKNLITESITYYESVGDTERVGSARSEIAYCYWRDGELNEARIMLHQALDELPAQGNTRARALLHLIVVESSALQFDVASRLLHDNAVFFESVSNHSLKGSYHNELAIVLRNLSRSEPSRRDDLLLKALGEFEKADHHFGLAKNSDFRATVKNNVALILFNLSRFNEAQKYVIEAQRLMVKDRVRVAQFEETQAQIFIAENKLTDAESVIRQSIQAFEKSGRQGLLAEALITQGIALARLKQHERAQYTFERAIEVANQVGASNIAGLAALTMIEELDHLSRTTLQSSFERASEGLAKSLNHDLIVRFNAAANKVYASLNREEIPEDSAGVISTPCNFQEEVLKFEGTLIRLALAQANGSVTRAASLLSLSYQALAYIIGGRHKDLLKERSPVRRRRSHKKEMQSRQLR